MELRSPWRGSGGVTFVLLKLVSTYVPLRVSREREVEGLDIPNMARYCSKFST
jgi:ammonia channel protein AmtB